MATTTNYSWTTPDDTGLVKDGASAIRSLGTAIDTTVYNNAQAAINKTIVDAKGDIIAATAADTVARLAVGTDGQVLTADAASAAGIKWATPAGGAGNLALITSGSMSGSSVTLSSLSSYSELYLIFYIDITTGTNFFLRINGNTGSNYDYSVVSVPNNSSYGAQVYQNNTGTYIPLGAANVGGSNDQNCWQIRLHDTKSTGYTQVDFTSGYTAQYLGSAAMATAGQGIYKQNESVSSITLGLGSGSFQSGCTYKLFGA